MKKLTLSLDEETITLAHRVARERNDSISHMVEDYFLSLKKNEKAYVPKSRIVRELYGSLKDLPFPIDKKDVRELLARKYLT